MTVYETKRSADRGVALPAPKRKARGSRARRRPRAGSKQKQGARPPRGAEQLTLARTQGHGGRRKGAGRKRIHQHADFPRHRPRPRLDERTPVHVTVRLRREVWNLRSHRAFRRIATAFQAVNKRKGFRLVHYAVMGNHLHLIVEAADARTLGCGMRALNIRLARRLNALMGHKGPLIDGRYWARQLRSPTEVRRALLYVLNNFRKHAVQFDDRRPVPAWWLDPYSSAAAFTGWRPLAARDHEDRCARELASVMRYCCPSGVPPVSPPSSWLLRIGWRLGCRPGEPEQIDRTQVPGGLPSSARRRGGWDPA